MFLGQYILPDQNKGLQSNWKICICIINYTIFHLGTSQLFPIQYQAEPLSLTKKWNFSNQPVHNNWNLQVDYHKKPPLHTLLCNVSFSSQSHPKTYLNWPWLENCHYRHDIRSGVSWRQPAHLLECYRLETAHQKLYQNEPTDENHPNNSQPFNITMPTSYTHKKGTTTNTSTVTHARIHKCNRWTTTS